MMDAPKDLINKALDILLLPKCVTKQAIKEQYHFLAKKVHPDKGGLKDEMEQLNWAYQFLMQYIEEFRYSFDEEEMSKQFPGADYVQRFKP